MNGLSRGLLSDTKVLVIRPVGQDLNANHLAQSTKKGPAEADPFLLLSFRSTSEP